MKPTILITAAITGVFAAECSFEDKGTMALARRYYVGAGLGANPEIPGRCGGLWDNLKTYSQCTVSDAWCGNGGNTPDHLHWEFTVPQICEGWMIESTWWEATRNDFGAVHCKRR